MTKTKLDQRRIDIAEESLEAAFWEFDARRKGYNRPKEDDRNSFKHAIRGHFPQWFDESGV